MQSTCFLFLASSIETGVFPEVNEPGACRNTKFMKLDDREDAVQTLVVDWSAIEQ